jgi:hypothetical protein
MFKKRTLFIVGAGASHEVGFPVGTGLAERISNMLLAEIAQVPDTHLLAQLYDKYPQPTATFNRAASSGGGRDQVTPGPAWLRPRKCVNWS